MGIKSEIIIPQNRRLPIRKAAKLAKMGYERIRKLIDDGKLTAFKVGGTDESPRLQVDVDEMERVIRRESIYVPPGSKNVRRQRREIPISDLDPSVLRWKTRRPRD